MKSSNRTGRVLAVVTLALATGGLSANSAHAAPVTLQEATTTFDQGGTFEIETTIDGITGTSSNGWGVFGGQSSSQISVWETQTDLGAFGSDLTFTMRHDRTDSHNIRLFRLSATTADRSQFGTAGDTDDVGPNSIWTELTPLTATATSGSLTINADNTISGTSASPTVYEITASSPLSNITGFRMEVFPDPNFLGHAGNGNFVLTEFEVDAVSRQPVPEPASIAIWSLLGLGLAGFGYYRTRRKK